MANELDPTTNQPTTNQPTTDQPTTNQPAGAIDDGFAPATFDIPIAADDRDETPVIETPITPDPVVEETVPTDEGFAPPALSAVLDIIHVPQEVVEEPPDEQPEPDEPHGFGKVAAIGKAFFARIVPERYREALRARREAAFDPSFYEDEEFIDEETAYPDNFDVTTTHSMPILEDVWEEEPPLAPSDDRATKHRRWGLAAAFAAVAATSFVAGGVASRLSSQVPVLIEQKPKTTENTASLTTPATPAPTEDTPEPSDDTPPAETTQSPTVTTTPHGQTDQQPTTTDTTTNDDWDEDDELTWDRDSESNHPLTYDTDSHQVYVEYNGHTYSYDLDSLFDIYGDSFGYQTDSNGHGYPYGTNDTYGTTDTYDPYTYDYRYEYDYGTGYDTEEDRDSYNWYNQRTTTYDYRT